MTKAKSAFPRMANFFENYRSAARQRQTVRALSGLSNHGLKDIGVDRSEIYSVAINASQHRK